VLVGLTLLGLGASASVLLDPRILRALSSESPVPETTRWLLSLSGARPDAKPTYTAIAGTPAGEPGADPSRPEVETGDPPRSDAPSRSATGSPRERIELPDLDFSRARMRFPAILMQPAAIPREVPSPERGDLPPEPTPAVRDFDFSEARSIFDADPLRRAPTGIALPAGAPGPGGRPPDEQPTGTVPPVPGR
jgi:hypothetical protein